MAGYMGFHPLTIMQINYRDFEKVAFPDGNYFTKAISRASRIPWT